MVKYTIEVLAHMHAYCTLTFVFALVLQDANVGPGVEHALERVAPLRLLQFTGHGSQRRRHIGVALDIFALEILLVRVLCGGRRSHLDTIAQWLASCIAIQQRSVKGVHAYLVAQLLLSGCHGVEEVDRDVDFLRVVLARGHALVARGG